MNVNYNVQAHTKKFSSHSSQVVVLHVPVLGDDHGGGVLGQHVHVDGHGQGTGPGGFQAQVACTDRLMGDGVDGGSSGGCEVPKEDADTLLIHVQADIAVTFAAQLTQVLV